MPTEEESTATPLDTAREWADLIETLVPPDSVEVQDISGATHRLRANISAANETKIMRLLKGVSLPDFGASATDMTAGAQDVRRALGGAFDVGISLFCDDAIRTAMSECFALANKKAMREAEENVRADEDLCEELPDGRVMAFHLFSTADILSGVVPFGLRAGVRIATTAVSLLPPKT